MRCLQIQSIILSFILLTMAACTPQSTFIVPAQISDPSPATSAPASTRPGAAAGTKTLTVLAAASLTESFNELGNLYETRNPGVKVSFSFAGSQQLALQLRQGASADVFASASQKYMVSAVEAKRVNKSDAAVFVKNRLVVIISKSNPRGLKALKDLANPGIKLDLADKSVPVGQYTLDFLSKASKDPAFGTAYQENVLKNVVSYEDNVKSVLTKVSLGEADAGIVYVTDISKDAANKVEKLDIPDAFNTIAAYPIAPISDSKNADLARAFVTLVLSPEGQAILAKYGFIPASH